jgi:hypothetical protein
LKEQVKTIPTLVEYITSAGTVFLKEAGTREERSAPERLSILRVKVWAGDFGSHRFEVAYQDVWTLSVDCYYTDSDFVRENTVWGKLPAWLQAEVQAQYPPCSCCRQRRDIHVSDSYGKCELCRAEEHCIRCEKKSTVKNLGGRLVCDKCQPYETAEQLIETSFPMERREAIAAEAITLLVGQALPQEVGEAILKTTLDHVATSWLLDRCTRKSTGYCWYYFCEDGIYGTKLAPAALQILQFLPQASGNGLVEMVAWLVEPPKASPTFYSATQVDGRVVTPTIAEHQLKQEIKVADFLRGSEADRIAAIVGYKVLVEKLGGESREARAVAEILQDEKQDYAAALTKIREAEKQVRLVEAKKRATTARRPVADPIPGPSGFNTMADKLKRAMENKDRKN